MDNFVTVPVSSARQAANSRHHHFQTRGKNNVRRHSLSHLDHLSTDNLVTVPVSSARQAANSRHHHFQTHGKNNVRRHSLSHLDHLSTDNLVTVPVSSARQAANSRHHHFQTHGKNNVRRHSLSHLDHLSTDNLVTVPVSSARQAANSRHHHFQTRGKNNVRRHSLSHLDHLSTDNLVTVPVSSARQAANSRHHHFQTRGKHNVRRHSLSHLDETVQTSNLESNSNFRRNPYHSYYISPVTTKNNARDHKREKAIRVIQLQNHSQQKLYSPKNYANKAPRQPPLTQKEWRSFVKKRADQAKSKVAYVSRRPEKFGKRNGSSLRQGRQKRNQQGDEDANMRYSNLRRKRSRSMWLCSALICVAVIIAAGVIAAVIIYSFQPGNDIPVITPVIPISVIPTEANNVTNQNGTLAIGADYSTSGEYPKNTWPHQGQGLNLEVHNALTQDWYPILEKVLGDWSDQSPKTLNLTIKEVASDAQCTPISGVLKVCNANYGVTGWRGINEWRVDEFNNLTSSVAKMNEHYLLNQSNDIKQYTMCHEIGHGWGLGHQNEDFNNVDSGSCMDYVMDPENNQHPNAKDHAILRQVYGTVATSGRNSSSHERAMYLRGSKFVHKEKFSNTQYISFTDTFYREQWRLLRKSSAMEIHELDFGNGKRMIAHLLLAETG